MAMDLFDSVMEGIVRAGREAGRVRFIGEVQTRLVGLRLARRGRRDALANEVMELYRRNAIHHPALVPLCRELDEIDTEIERLDAALARARGNEAAARPSSPVVTEITAHQPPHGHAHTGHAAAGHTSTGHASDQSASERPASDGPPSGR